MVKPILFNTEMIRAILDGRKTVTRRVIKPQPKMQLSYICMGDCCGKWSYPPKDCVEQGGWDEKYRRIDGLTAEDDAMRWTPPCHGDDILYVRETFARVGNEKAGRPMHYEYRASCENPDYFSDGFMAEWRPSVHMPKEAARIWLKVTGISAERLRPMGLDELEAEGMNTVTGLFQTTAKFADMWDSTIKKSDLGRYGWEANPWVWVIAFERCEKPESEA